MFLTRLLQVWISVSEFINNFVISLPIYAVPQTEWIVRNVIASVRRMCSLFIV